MSQLGFPEIISMTAIVISISTFVFTVIKERGDKKDRAVSKKTTVLMQLSSTILLLDEITLEYKKWLAAEIRLWPDDKDKLEERSIEERDCIKEVKARFQTVYDQILNSSRVPDAQFLEELHAGFHSFHTGYEAIKSEITYSKNNVIEFNQRYEAMKSELVRAENTVTEFNQRSVRVEP